MTFYLNLYGFLKWKFFIHMTAKMYYTDRLKGLVSIAFALFFVMFTGSCSETILPETSDIRFNQLGFYPSGEKSAVLVSDIPAEKFVVRNVETGKVVYSGSLSEYRQSSFSDKETRVISFSEVTTPGKYRIEIPKTCASAVFEVKENVLDDVSVAAVKAFYYQRMGIPIEEKYAGKWNRSEGHPDNKVQIHPSAVSPGRPAGAIIESPKGWYDAGDYNKYIVNSGYTVGLLLSLYEDYSEHVKNLNVNIPESMNKTPDVLDEAYWNLAWMLTMQDPVDGGVYHKLTTARFEGFVKPTDCEQIRYVVAKSVTAALDFAASMAQASRIYSAYEEDYPGFSERALVAAIKAYDWAIKHPDVLYRQRDMNQKYKPEVVTGEYGDRSASDEFYWAAVELYLTTGDSKYISTIKRYVPERFASHSWSNVYGLGQLSLIRLQSTISDEDIKSLAEDTKSQLLHYTDSLLVGVEQAPYISPYGKQARDFYWGCNGGASAQGIAFLYAWQMTNDRTYLTNALRIMDYILGKNATGYCYITGYGTKSPMHIHHRLSASDDIEDPIPGLIAGGPNPGKQDGCEYPSDIPDECFVDVQESYASNEIAINWQAEYSYFSVALNYNLK